MSFREEDMPYAPRPSSMVMMPSHLINIPPALKQRPPNARQTLLRLLTVHRIQMRMMGMI